MKHEVFALFSFIIFSTSAINAQLDSDLVGSRDTIFIYDTLVVVDTIRISRPPIDFKDLEKLSSKKLSYLEVKNAHSNEKLFIFSNGQTATLSDSNIKSVNNNFNSKKSDEMKKIGFLGVVLFAFQNMVLAQNDVGVYLGSGIHNIIVEDLENTEFAPSIHVGLSYQKSISKDKMFFNAKLNYSRLTTTDFKFTDSLYINVRSLPEITGPFPIEEIETETIAEEANVSSQFNLFSVPLTLGINGRIVRPFWGVEPYYRTFTHWYQTSTPDVSTSEPSFFRGHSSYELGLNVMLGFQISLSKRLSINAAYARQITNGYEQVLNTKPNTSIKNQRMDLTLRYRLFKKES